MSGTSNLGSKNRAKVKRLLKLNVMQEIRRQALDIQVRLMDSDINVVGVAEKDVERLIKRFYNENQDMMAPQQYEAARKNFGYFLTLIETAIGYYRPGDYDIGTVP